MNKYEIIKRIENFAPLDCQEEWDCSGWLVDINGYDEIDKILLCLTVTDDVIAQALEQKCDLIISHHPMFYINCQSKLFSKDLIPNINIYCAHTNMDKANGGTTDTLIDSIGLSDYKIDIEHDFLRIIDYPVKVEDFNEILKNFSPNARIINNHKINHLRRIAFCAGSGSEFINFSQALGADCLVTGDLKFHSALEAEIVVYDIGHFESEIIILPVFEKIIGPDIEIIYAQEQSPFMQI